MAEIDAHSMLLLISGVTGLHEGGVTEIGSATGRSTPGGMDGS